MSTKPNHSSKSEMLIRKPISEVFEAFIHPEITTKFWFTHSSGKLTEGAKIDWSWEMYSLTVPVLVKNIQFNKEIIIEWGEGEHNSTVRWNFTSLSESKTFVEIRNDDFQGSDEEIIHKVIDSTGGFTIVLAGLKAWLEYNVELNLIADKFPKELMDNK